MRWRFIVIGLLLAVVLTGCREGDRRPWVICNRIYEQCREKVPPLTQTQCVEQLSTAPAPVLEYLLLCTRERQCPGVGVECFKTLKP